MSKFYRFDYKGNLLSEKTFDELSTINKEFSSARKGKKMGVVKNDTLELVVDIMYDKYDYYESISLWENKNEKYQFKVFLDEKTLIIDEKNNVLQSYSYKNIQNQKDFIITYLNNLKGVIYKNGDVLFEPRFSSCEIISNNRILAKEANAYFIYDEKGKLLKSVEANFIRYVAPNNILQVHFEKNGKNGLFDDDFNVLIENIYDEIKVVNDNLFFVRNGNQTIALNKYNEIVKNFDFPFVMYDAVKLKNGEYNYVIAKDKSYDAKKGLLNEKFELVVPIECNWFEYNEEVWIVKKGRSDFLYGINHEEIKGVKYKEIGKFEPTGVSCTADEEGKYRFIDYNGNIINNQAYDKVYLGRNSLLNNLFSNDMLAVSVNGKWGYINKSGNLITEIIYEEAREFDLRGFALVKHNGKWGVINKLGESVIPIQFEEILKFDYNGNAIVKQNSKWGVINTKGEIIIDFSFESIIAFDLERKVIKSQKENFYGLIDFNNEIIIPHLADSLWLKDGYIDVRSKKSVFKKIADLEKITKPVKEKVKIKKPAEPISLLEKKYVKTFDSLNHSEIVRAMILAVMEEKADGFFKIYMIDFVNRDGTSSTYINGYTGGGVWESFSFINDREDDGSFDCISAFDLAYHDEQIHSLIKKYLCDFDDDADEYRYNNLEHFIKIEEGEYLVLNPVWFEKGFDFTDISKNDKKRFKSLLKQCYGIYWQKWNFKF